MKFGSGKAFVGNSTGQWHEMGMVGPIEVDESSPEWEESIPTLRSFRGSLTFLVEPELRQVMLEFIRATLRVADWVDGIPRRSAMHSAYRAKTRRRNRRRR